MKARYQLILLTDGSVGPTFQSVEKLVGSFGATAATSERAWAWVGKYRSYDSIVRQLESVFESATTPDVEGAVLFAWPQTWCGSCAEPYFDKLIRVMPCNRREDARQADKAELLSKALAIVQPPTDSDEYAHRDLQPISRAEADEIRRKLIEGGAAIELL